MRSLLVFLFPLLLGEVAASQSFLTWAHTESELPVDEKAHFGELENGMRYVIYPNAEPPQRVSLRLHVDAGSLHEDEDQRGMAHFLEHMLFNGSKNFTSAELIPQMQRLGIGFGAHANAYTTFDETVYMLDLPNLEDNTLDLGFTVMRDFCDGALLTEEGIESERGVILSEKNSRDSVDLRLMKKQFSHLIPDHKASRRFPIGIEKTIKGTPPERIRQFYKAYYDPKRITFVVVGDVEVKEFEEKIRQTFQSFTSPENPGEPVNIGSITEPDSLTTAVFTDEEVDEEDISIIRCLVHDSKPDTEATREGLLPLQIAMAVVSRRFDKLAKKEGAPINGGSAYKNTWFDSISFGALSVTPSEGKWQEAVPLLEQEFRRALQYGFTQAEYQEVVGSLLKSAEMAVDSSETRQSSSLAMQLISSINNREVFTTPKTDLEVLKDTLEKVSPERCHQEFKDFWNVPGYHLVLTTTNDNGEAQKTLETLYAKSQTVEVEELQEAEKITFAYESFGNTSQVSHENTEEDLGISQLQLTNGVNINLKETDFEKGRVYVNVRIQGGNKEATKKGIKALTEKVFLAGGLGKHNADDLMQLFAGNAIGTTFTIDEESFNFGGATNQSDLELQLQLICAYITDPGLREEAIRLYRKSLPDQYDQLSQTLEGAFSYLNAFSHGGDKRFAVPTEEEAKALTVQDIRDWVTPYLSAAPIEVSIIGDINLDQTKEAILQTVGTLPSRFKALAPADTALESLPQPPLQKTFTYTSELDRAAAVVAWRTTGLTNNMSEVRRLSVLSSILRDRMRQEVRERLGSSYSPRAHADSSEVYDDYGHLSAISICKASDLEQINTLLLELGHDLATEGATQDELDRALTPTLKSIDASLRNNSYWLGSVMRKCQEQPQRLQWARSRSEDYSSITIEEINELAKKYLQKANAFTYSLHSIKD